MRSLLTSCSPHLLCLILSAVALLSFVQVEIDAFYSKTGHYALDSNEFNVMDRDNQNVAEGSVDAATESNNKKALQGLLGMMKKKVTGKYWLAEVEGRTDEEREGNDIILRSVHNGDDVDQNAVVEGTTDEELELDDSIKSTFHNGDDVDQNAVVEGTTDAATESNRKKALRRLLGMMKMKDTGKYWLAEVEGRTDEEREGNDIILRSVNYGNNVEVINGVTLFFKSLNLISSSVVDNLQSKDVCLVNASISDYFSGFSNVSNVIFKTMNLRGSVKFSRDELQNTEVGSIIQKSLTTNRSVPVKVFYLRSPSFRDSQYLFEEHLAISYKNMFLEFLNNSDCNELRFVPISVNEENAPTDIPLVRMCPKLPHIDLNENKYETITNYHYYLDASTRRDLYLALMTRKALRNAYHSLSEDNRKKLHTKTIKFHESDTAKLEVMDIVLKLL